MGFGCPVLITYALREESPQLVYAFTLGSGFVLLQLAAWWWFKAPVTGDAIRWARVDGGGVGDVAVGAGLEKSYRLGYQLLRRAGITS